MPRVHFELTDNPNKPITDNTRKIYQANLNRVAKALEITTARQLIDRARDVIYWMDAQHYEVQQKKLFLSAIFYAVNKLPFTDIDRKLYIDEFRIAKNIQIGKLDEDENAELIARAKEKVLISKAVQQENIRQELQDLQEEVQEAEEKTRIAKKKLADAKKAIKQAI